MRINPDGSIPKDNPFVGRSGARPEIWSYGHRNVQAAALHPETGQLWTVEHGARGGDELNHPGGGEELRLAGDHLRARLLGREDRRGDGQGRDGAAGVLLGSGDRAVGRGCSTPAIAYPGWKGSLFVGSMQPGALVRLTVENGRVTKEERYLGELGERIRDVQQGPDGLLYVVTDEGRRPAAAGGAEGLDRWTSLSPNPSAARATSRS